MAFQGYSGFQQGTCLLAPGGLGTVGSITIGDSKGKTDYLADSGTLQIDIASATSYDTIQNWGNVFLADANGNNPKATLAVNRNSNSYRPNQGDTFTLLTTATGGTIQFTMTGNFSSITSNIPGWLRTNRDVAINLSDPNTYRPVFSGAVVDSNAYVVTFQGARGGDVNGDQRVNSTDLGYVGGSWLKPGGTFTWLDGDFNGDGVVNTTDLGTLGGNWLWTGAWPGPAPADAPLPEPATLALLSLGGLAAVRRRRGL